MNVFFAASEAAPFCKTGGLGDVAGALPAALAARGASVRLFLPRYRDIPESLLSGAESVGDVLVPFSGERIPASLEVKAVGSFQVWFVSCPRFFDRDGLYGSVDGDHPDNGDRFAFFSRAVIESARIVSAEIDVVHCHDWQTGLIPAFLKTGTDLPENLRRAAAVFTIHNLAFQGIFPKEDIPRYGLPWSSFTPEGLEFHDRVSFLKSGIAYADRINAVSPTYAREILGTEHGCGMDGALRARGRAVSGILNGIDTVLWDPRVDPHIVRRYGEDSFQEGKAECKQRLQSIAKIDRDPNACMIASVSRLSHQKGLDLALEAVEFRLAQGDQYVLLGQGDRSLRDAYRELARRFPGRAAVLDVFDEPTAHAVYAGADLFLMPSRFEPCGLGQLIALRYGTIPVAVATGGLADTVPPHGFLAPKPASREIFEALESARAQFLDSASWAARVRKAMAGDPSWSRFAREYEILYRSAVDEVRGLASR